MANRYTEVGEQVILQGTTPKDRITQVGKMTITAQENPTVNLRVTQVAKMTVMDIPPYSNPTYVCSNCG